MGRIAAALRRAQQERARQRDQGGGDGADPASSIPVETQGQRAWLSPDSPSGDSCCAASCLVEQDVLGKASILDTGAPVLPEPVSTMLHSHGDGAASRSTPIPQEAVDARVVALHDPQGQIAEKYRSLRTRLLTANVDGSARLLAITSSLPKEGKTTTTANLGFSLAELRHLRVAMIDLDFRQRGLGAVFQNQDGPGIAEVLRGERKLDEVCLRVVRENLYLVPAGDLEGAHPSELLVGQSVRRVVRELNERFHYSLIDVPPVDNAADVGLIGPLCHAALLVVRMNRTPEPVVRRCVKMLQANRVIVAGCILAGYEETAASFDTHDHYESGS